MMRRFTLKGLVNAALVTLCAVAVSACGDDDSGLTFTPPPRVVVLSAFPAEMAFKDPAHADVVERMRARLHSVPTTQH